MQEFDAKNLWDKFEQDGPDKVERDITNKVYGQDKRPHAELFVERCLRKEEQIRHEAVLDEAREANRIAKLANTIADEAKTAARKAHRVAIAAVVVSIGVPLLLYG